MMSIMAKGAELWKNAVKELDYVPSINDALVHPLLVIYILTSGITTHCNT